MPETKTMVLAANGPIVLYAEGLVEHKQIDTDTIWLRNQSSGGCTVYQVGVQDAKNLEFIRTINVPASFVEPNSNHVLYNHSLHDSYLKDYDFKEIFWLGDQYASKVLIFKILSSVGEVEIRITAIPSFFGGKFKLRITLPETQEPNRKA